MTLQDSINQAIAQITSLTQFRQGSFTTAHLVMMGLLMQIQQAQSQSNFSQASIGVVTTSSTGSNWVTLPAGACRLLDLVNPSNVAIEYRRNGAGESMVILPASSRAIVGITNSNQIDVRRLDQNNSPVTLHFERLS